MKNITEDIQQAISKDTLWAIDLFFNAIEKLKLKGFNTSFWQNEENWATILKEKKVIGYLWKKYPVLFAISNHSIELRKVLSNYDFISFIEVESLDTKELEMNLNLLKDIDAAAIGNNFSVEDLWFITNSL